MKAVRVLTPGPVGVGSRCEADVRILGITVSDPVEVVEFSPPHRFAIRHEGLFKGGGLITLDTTDGGRRTRVEWSETLVPPLLANLGTIAQAPILGRIFQADLERLRTIVEGDRAGSTADRPGDPRRAARRWSEPSLRRTATGRPRPAEPGRPTAPRPERPVDVHLVDATYELFRAHFAPRPPVRGRDGRDPLGRGRAVDQLLLTSSGRRAPRHVGCATDHVIRSFRNDLYAGYKTEAGVPAELLAQFPLAERAIEALGLVSGRWSSSRRTTPSPRRWPAGRRHRGRADPRSARRTRTWPSCVEGDRVVLWDRRRRVVLRRGRGDRQVGRPARRRSPTGWPSSATRPTGSRACPAGARSPPPPSSPGTARSRRSRAGRPPGTWPVGVRNAVGLAATLTEQWEDALLYRELARLRTDAPIDQVATSRSSAGRARRATRWEAFCDELGPGPAARPSAPLAAELTDLSRAGRTELAAGGRGGPAAQPPPRTSSVAPAEVEPRPAGLRRSTRRAGPLGDEPGRGDVPGRQAVGLGEDVEATVRDVGQGAAPRSPIRRVTRIASRTAARRSATAVGRRSSSEMTKSDMSALGSSAIGDPSSGRRAVDGGRERLVADRVVDDPDGPAGRRRRGRSRRRRSGCRWRS